MSCHVPLAEQRLLKTLLWLVCHVLYENLRDRRLLILRAVVKPRFIIHAKMSGAHILGGTVCIWSVSPLLDGRQLQRCT